LTQNRRLLPSNTRSLEINDTYDSQTEENNFYGSIIIAKTV